MFIDTDKKSIGFGDFPASNGTMEVYLKMLIDKALSIKGDSKTLEMGYNGSVCTIKETGGGNTDFNITGNLKPTNVNAENYVEAKKGLQATNAGQIITEVDLGNGRKSLMFGNDCIGFVGDRVLYSNTPGLWPTETFNWTSPVPLDKCPNGWIIMWTPYSSPNGADYLWGFTYIPKSIIHSDPVKRGKPIGFDIYTKTGDSTPITKYLTITNTGLKGDPDNGNNDPAKKKALRHILVW